MKKTLEQTVSLAQIPETLPNTLDEVAIQALIEDFDPSSFLDIDQPNPSDARKHFGLLNDLYRQAESFGLTEDQSHQLGSLIQKGAYSLASRHLTALEVRYLEFGPEYIDDTGISTDTTLQEVEILGECWDNTDRDHKIISATKILLQKLPAQEARVVKQAFAEAENNTESSFHENYVHLTSKPEKASYARRLSACALEIVGIKKPEAIYTNSQIEDLPEVMRLSELQRLENKTHDKVFARAHTIELPEISSLTQDWVTDDELRALDHPRQKAKL